MALASKDSLRTMVRSIVPRTRKPETQTSEKRKAAELHMHQMAKEAMKKMNL